MIPASLCHPAKAHPAGNEGGCGCGDQCIRENEQTKKVFWTMFVPMTGLVLAQVPDPGTARQVAGVITGAGG